MFIMALFLWGIAAWWGLACMNLAANWLLLPRLSRMGCSEPPPSLSVVIPARDEERDIGAAVTSHCTQDYPGLRVVVVDDRSTDGTRAILDRLAQRYESLEVVDGREPPRGWLGKPHAIMLGLDHVRSDLVLVVDADVRMDPGVLHRAAGEMVRHDLDCLLMIPELEGRGLEPMVMSFWPALLLYIAPSYLMNLPTLKSLATGAPSGLLVRREALEAAGGMAAIAMEIPNDAALGKLMKRYRGRYRVVLAMDCVRVRMYRGLRECVKGFTKNCYRFYLGNPVLALAAKVDDLSVHCLPLLAVAGALIFPALRPIAAPGAIALTAGIICNALSGLRGRQALWTALVFPLRSVLWTYILLLSVRQYYGRGIEWRGRRYGRIK